MGNFWSGFSALKDIFIKIKDALNIVDSSAYEKTKKEIAKKIIEITPSLKFASRAIATLEDIDVILKASKKLAEEEENK